MDSNPTQIRATLNSSKLPLYLKVNCIEKDSNYFGSQLLETKGFLILE